MILVTHSGRMSAYCLTTLPSALATAHSTSHYHYPVPTIGHLRLQMYADLAYGAQCLQYFTYWTPVGTRWDFHAAPLNADGTKNETYCLIRDFNKEIQARADVFLGCEVRKVSHVGEFRSFGRRHA